jgi:large subunit ribosomal protein L9
MNVILLDKIHNLGNLGDQVRVKNGFGRNYLIPHGKAVPATATNIALFEERRAELERELAAKIAAAKQRAVALEKLALTIPALVSEEGKLFGSVGAPEIVEAIVATGAEAHKAEICLPNGPIRAIGDYEVELHLHHGEVIAKVKVAIVAEK